MHRPNFLTLAFCLCAAIASTFAGERAPQGHPIEGLKLGADTTFVTAPLNELGYPDYAAALDRQYAEGVDPKDNFWTLFMTILPRAEFNERFAAQLARRPGFETALDAQPRFVDLGEGLAPEDSKKQIDEHEKSSSAPWKAGSLPMIASWLKTNAEPLRIAAEAARRPKTYAPLISTSDPPTLVSVLLPHVQRTRSIARALDARAMLNIGEGRSDAAWQDVMTMHRIAAHLDTSAIVIERLVGMAIGAMAQKATVLSLVDPRLSSAQLEQRWRDLADVLPARSHIASVVQSDRFMSLDLTLALRSGAVTLNDLGVSSVAPPSEGAGPATFIDFRKVGKTLESLLVNSGDVNEVLAYVNSFHNGVEEALSRETYSERKAELQRVIQEFGVDKPVTGTAAAAFLLAGADGLDFIGKQSIIRLFSSAYNQVHVAEGRALARSALLHAAIAAELLYRENGEDAASGEQLEEAAAALAQSAGVAAPRLVDPFTGGAFKVRRTEEGLMIYSLGDNQKDEAGKTYGEGNGTDDISVSLNRSTQ